MASQKHDKFYLQKAKLSGFKSIKNTEAEFNSGLNIIIGKNAVGKTNFLKFLDAVVGRKYDDLLSFQSEIEFRSNDKIDIKAFREMGIKGNNINDLLKKNKVEEIININSTKVDDFNIAIYNSFIRHGIYQKTVLLEKPLNFTFNIEKLNQRIIDLNDDFYISIIESRLLFINTLGIMLSFNLEQILKLVNMNKFEELVDFLDEILIDSKFKNFLMEYSPIKNIRCSKDLRSKINNSKEELSVSNIYFEYFVNDEWYTFNDLSDGTKRLLFIIAEVCFPKSVEVKNEEEGHINYHFAKNENEIIFLEEPELGIHPHQLMQLMNFIKEVSKDKQIIITTHSPLVLDVLSKDELDSINIAYIENAKEGTKIRKLNAQEIKKAQLYMEDAYLSDYWKYSDLES